MIIDCTTNEICPLLTKVRTEGYRWAKGRHANNNSTIAAFYIKSLSAVERVTVKFCCCLGAREAKGWNLTLFCVTLSLVKCEG